MKRTISIVMLLGKEKLIMKVVVFTIAVLLLISLSIPAFAFDTQLSAQNLTADNNDKTNTATEANKGTEQSKHATNYDPVIDHYQIPAGLGFPQYDVDEIKQMITDNLSLDEVADRIATYADLIQYLHQKGYVIDSGDLKFTYEGYQFHVNRSAQTVFNNNKGNCGGGSNLVNYILRDDYDFQGYVQESGEQGGHIYNFFISDGVYYFADLIQIVGPENAYNHNYAIYATKDPQEFSNWYISENHKYYASNAGPYCIFQYLYPYDGDQRPIGNTKSASDMTLSNKPYLHYLPKSLESIATILFVDDRYEGAVFVDDPPLELWPKEAK